MDFQTFCSTYFKGDEAHAIRQLIWEGEEKTYRRTGSQEGLQAIMDTMNREQVELYRQAKEKKAAENRVMSNVGAGVWIIVGVIFLGLMVWMLASGWNNLAIRQDLRENGVPVTVTVTDKTLVKGAENDYDNYTFTYTVEGTTYTFVDSPDHGYDVGDTFQEYVDPQHPEELVLVSDNLPIFFLLTGMILAWPVLFVSKKLRRYFVLALAGLWVLVVATGLMFGAHGYTVIGCILLALMLLIWLLRKRKKRA